MNQEINTVNPPKSEIIPLRLRERIRSIQYCLLSRENDDISGSGDQLPKACRLGVLLYAVIIQNEFLTSPISKQLIWQLKSCLLGENFTTNSTRVLRLWLLFLASPLVMDPVDKSWFVGATAEVISQLSVLTWHDSKWLLEGFAWAGKVQDKSGQDLWDEATRMQE